MTNVATPGMVLFGTPMFGRELWGWRAWIPLLVAAPIALAVTRPSRPLARLATNIGQDWTLLTFGMFAVMPLLVAIGFDEMDRLTSLYFMVPLALLMTGVALVHMRSRQPRGRIMALAIGILTARSAPLWGRRSTGNRANGRSPGRLRWPGRAWC
ncbi:MAG: hypothetical protein HY784_01160 [Chloroflexi bacterium]|nr:hypothetical protein [Chloroflexota bacterium]